MTWLAIIWKYITYIWNNPVTRGIIFALTAIFGVMLYGLHREREGVREAKEQREKERAKNAAKLEREQSKAVKQASDIRDDADAAVDSVPGAILPDYHYRAGEPRDKS